MRSGVLYRPVAPVKPAAGYIGGKKQLAKAIIACIDRIPHETYAEPFVELRNYGNYVDSALNPPARLSSLPLKRQAVGRGAEAIRDLLLATPKLATNWHDGQIAVCVVEAEQVIGFSRSIRLGFDDRPPNA